MFYFGRLLAALIAIVLSVTAASADTYYYIQGSGADDAVPTVSDVNTHRLELYHPGHIDRYAGDCPSPKDVTQCVGGLFWSVEQPTTDDWTACTNCTAANFNTYTNIDVAGYGNYHSGQLNGFTSDNYNAGGTGTECGNSIKCSGQNFGFIFAPLEVGTGGNSALTTIYTFALSNDFAGGKTPWASTNDLVVSMNENVTYAGFDTSCKTVPNTVADCGDTIAYVSGLIEDTNGNTIFLSGRANVAFTTTATDNVIFQSFNSTTQGYILQIPPGTATYQVYFDVSTSHTRYGSSCDTTTFSSTLAGNPGGVYCIRISSTQLKNIIDDLNSTYSQTFSDTASNWHLMAVEADVEVWDWNGHQQAAKCGTGSSNCDNKMGFITDTLTAQIVAHANVSPTFPVYYWTQTTVANTVETFIYTHGGGAATPWYAYSATEYYPGIAWYGYRTNPGTGYTAINLCQNSSQNWDFMPENGSCPTGFTQYGKLGYLANSSGGSNTNAVNRCHWAGTGQTYNDSHLIVLGSDSSICTGGTGWTHDKTIGYAPNS